MRDIGSRRELFVDDWLIDRLDGARLQVHRPTPQGVAFPFNAPWEGGGAHYVTMMQVGDEFRCYYRGFYNDKRGVTCLAFSRDGVVWEKPTLGVYSWDGLAENEQGYRGEVAGARERVADTNIILRGEPSGTFAPFLDTNPATPPGERFKALAAERIEPREVRRWPYLFPWVSEDGIHWQKWRNEPVISDGAFDSQNLAYWDAYRGHYVAFYRDFFLDTNGERIRGIKWATSPDFINWTPGQWFQYNDVGDEHYYTNGTISYFRAPHLYLSFPKRFSAKRQVVMDYEYPGVSDAVFMSSRDGLHWYRFREAFIRPTRERNTWTDRTNGPAWGILQTGPEELSVYWVDHFHHPTNRLSRGTLRLDGFASLTAPFVGGEVVTKPLRFEGSELVLNYETSGAGSVRVEIQDENGVPIPGFTLIDHRIMYGNEIDGVVNWQRGSNVASLAGRPVRLRFILSDADVYALQFRA